MPITLTSVGGSSSDLAAFPEWRKGSRSRASQRQGRRPSCNRPGLLSFYGLGLNSSLILQAIGYGAPSVGTAAEIRYINPHNISVGKCSRSRSRAWISDFLSYKRTRLVLLSSCTASSRTSAPTLLPSLFPASFSHSLPCYGTWNKCRFRETGRHHRSDHGLRIKRPRRNEPMARTCIGDLRPVYVHGDIIHSRRP